VNLKLSTIYFKGFMCVSPIALIYFEVISTLKMLKSYKKE